MIEIFGPIRSRRLGLSLGVNHLPPKTCSYSCVYCQLGRTSRMTARWTNLSDAQEIYAAVKKKLDELAGQSIRPDIVTFVPNGEPTLDKEIGDAIRLVNGLGIRTAVISNSSLLWRPGVRAQLLPADVVSLKIDTVYENTWHQIDRPHGSLCFENVLEGVSEFAGMYQGRLLTETMLVRDLNDSEMEARAAAQFIADLRPSCAYLALPLRPPAEDWVLPPESGQMLAVFNIFRQSFNRVELLMYLPDVGLPATDKPLESLVGALKVHPMNSHDIRNFLDRNSLSQKSFQKLLKKNLIIEIAKNNQTFYIANYMKVIRKSTENAN